MNANDWIQELETGDRVTATQELISMGAAAGEALLYASFLFNQDGKYGTRDAAIHALQGIAFSGTEKYINALTNSEPQAWRERYRAAYYLGWASHPMPNDLVVLIAGFLKASNCAKRAAAIFLDEMETDNPIAVSALLDALADYPREKWDIMTEDDVKTCGAILSTLQGYQDARAVPSLAGLLNHPDHKIAAIAAVGLCNTGEPAGESIRAAVAQALIGLRETPRPLRELELLGILGTADCVTAVAVQACDFDAAVRASAITALGSLPLRPEQGVTVAEMLMAGMGDPEESVRLAAVRSFTKQHAEMAIAYMCSQRRASAEEAEDLLLAPLRAAANDENEHVRSAASAALAARTPVPAKASATADPAEPGTETLPSAESDKAPETRQVSPDISTEKGPDAALVSLWTNLEGDWDSQIAIVITAEAIRAALAGGADVNAHNKDGTTALMASAWGDHTEVVQLLLEMKAQVNAIDVYGRTALMEAAYGGHAEVVRLLLEAGADWIVTDNEGKTAAHEAKNPNEIVPEKNKIATVAILQKAIDARFLSLWARPNGWFDSNKARATTVDAAQAILKAGADIEAQDQMGDTALITAVRIGQRDLISFLLDAGADPNVNESKFTAIKIAVGKGNIEIMSLLLEAGADPDGGRFGWTALSWAVVYDDVEAVRLLLAAGADPDAPNESGETILLDMKTHPIPEIFDLLLKAGADRDAVDNCGRTALMLAATNGNVDGVQLFIEAGVNIGHMDMEGHTALWHAENPEPDVPEEAKAQTVAALRVALNAALLALWNGDSDSLDRSFPSRRMIQAVLAGGAEVNGVAKNGWTALLRACDYSHTLGVGLLLENGADAEATTPDGL